MITVMTAPHDHTIDSSHLILTNPQLPLETMGLKQRAELAVTVIVELPTGRA